MRDGVYIENGVCRYAELLDDILFPLLGFAQSWLSAHKRPGRTFSE